MSGGYFDDKNRVICDTAMELQNLKDSNYKSDDFDYLQNADEEDRAKIVLEIEKLIKDLNEIAIRVKAIDYFLSGDIGSKTMLNRINDIK